MPNMLRFRDIFRAFTFSAPPACLPALFPLPLPSPILARLSPSPKEMSKKLSYCRQHALSVITSSSAVAKKPRDASCLSVVSFNSTKRRAESFIDSYVGYRFITACN